MRSSFKKEDVTVLLKDITGLVTPLPSEKREREIQSGRHYSEMLPLEYVPTKEYMEIYFEALELFGQEVADAAAALGEEILRRRGRETVLVSLARAGIPAGILIKRYLEERYGLSLPHYAISIIRGRGIDQNAMGYLLARYSPGSLLFVDGWIGKGAILRELEKETKALPGVSPELAVLSDPSGLSPYAGTYRDILIPSSCLNATVSGLISRTFLRGDIIGPKDFHGAMYYEEYRSRDLTYDFIDRITALFPKHPPASEKRPDTRGMDEVRNIAKMYGVEDINFIKPGIGETTRVLLRRVPWKVVISCRERENPRLAPVLRLAAEREVPLEFLPLEHYSCCGLIKKLGDV